MKIKEFKPPRLAKEMLLWFLRSDLAEEVQGDLDEKLKLSASGYTGFKD